MIDDIIQAIVPAAVFWGTGAAIALSAVAGFILGAGLMSDVVTGKDNENAPSPDDEAELGAAMERAIRRPAALLQLTVLSILATAVSGALTARLAPDAPYVNAGAVGVIGTVLAISLAPRLRDLPLPLVLFSIIATVPATLAGAWLVS